MDNLTFGLSLLVVGLGGTLASLGALAMLMGLPKRMFPLAIRKDVEPLLLV